MHYKYLNCKNKTKYLLLSAIICLDKALTASKKYSHYKIRVLPLYISIPTVQTVGRMNNNIKFEVRSNEGHHNVAHFHITVKGKGQGSYRIDNLEPIQTNLDSKTEKTVLEWADANRNLLVDTWNSFHGNRITVF